MFLGGWPKFWFYTLVRSVPRRAFGSREQSEAPEAAAVFWLINFVCTNVQCHSLGIRRPDTARRTGTLHLLVEHVQTGPMCSHNRDTLLSYISASPLGTFPLPSQHQTIIYLVCEPSYISVCTVLYYISLSLPHQWSVSSKRPVSSAARLGI